MPNYIEHDIPKKSHLSKLQVKHAVTGGDEVKAIASALEEIEKATKAKAEMLDFLPTLNELLRTIKQFKTKQKAKHPKFIKALEDDFEKPAAEILKKVENVRAAPQTLRDWAAEAEKKWKEAATHCKSTLDAAGAKAICKAMEDAANLVSAAANQAQLIISALGELDNYRKVMDEVQSIKTTKNQLDRALQEALRDKNAPAALAKIEAAVKKGVTECLSKTTHLSRLVK